MFKFNEQYTTVKNKNIFLEWIVTDFFSSTGDKTQGFEQALLLRSYPALLLIILNNIFIASKFSN
jgi:hypothetical protein